MNLKEVEYKNNSFAAKNIDDNAKPDKKVDAVVLKGGFIGS